MKLFLLKAKELLKQGKIAESLALVKKISHAVKNNMVICPECETESPSITKNDNLHAECAKCGSIWGNTKVNIFKYEGDTMDKKQIISILWSLYRAGDKDVLPVDVNHFEKTGQLRKSLAEKIGISIELQKSKELDPERLADLDIIIEKAVSNDAKEWISGKIKLLMDKEGLSQKQAVGKAYGMARSKFSKVPVKKSVSGDKEHYDKYEKIAQQIGVDKLKRLVPADKSTIESALQSDQALNNIRLPKWDAMHEGVRGLAGQAGIKSWSLSDTVCTLKHVARHHIAGASEVKKSEDEKSDFDLLGHIMDYEGGSLDDAGVKRLFQHIVDNRLDRTLQGHYGRTAQALLNAGHIRPPKHAPKVDKDVAMKKSEEFLTKDEILNIMLNLYKNNEEPEYIHPRAIAKFEATNEIMDEAVKIVYRKAGKDYMALRKAKKICKEEMCKEGEEVPPEAGGKLRRPRPLSEAPVMKKPKKMSEKQAQGLADAISQNPEGDATYEVTLPKKEKK